jgi:hypothetical protein
MENLWVLSSRLRKRNVVVGFCNLWPLTGVVYISKSWVLLGHSDKATKTERSDVAVSTDPRRGKRK